jgi:hypothetical protein
VPLCRIMPRNHNRPKRAIMPINYASLQRLAQALTGGKCCLRIGSAQLTAADCEKSTGMREWSVAEIEQKCRTDHPQLSSPMVEPRVPSADM